MEKIIGPLFGLSSVAGALAIGIIAGIWGSTELQIPPVIVGIATGLVAFVVVLISCAVIFAQVGVDLLFYKSCRSFFGEMLMEHWYNWKCLLPATIAAVAAWMLFGPWGALLAGVWTLLFCYAAVYIYGRGEVMNSIGHLFYHN